MARFLFYCSLVSIGLLCLCRRTQVRQTDQRKRLQLSLQWQGNLRASTHNTKTKTFSTSLSTFLPISSPTSSPETSSTSLFATCITMSRSLTDAVKAGNIAEVILM